MSNFAVTFTPYFKKSVLRELKTVDTNAKFVKVFSDDIAFVESEKSQELFLNDLNASKPVFIKHICPLKLSGRITCKLDDDKQLILDAILSSGIKIAKDEKFAIQGRIIAGGFENGLEYSSKDLAVFIGDFFVSLGGVPVFSDKKIISEDNVTVISIIINGIDFYIGKSLSSQNINFNCDEYRVSSLGGRREISRAENKLKEALIRYKVHLSGIGAALDIGAAPGGWTKVLADYGYDVVAVDPAELNPELVNNPKIKHFKCRIEELKFDNYFDIITDDMNVEPVITAEIMNGLAPTLKVGGYAIVTLKLPDNPDKGVKEAREKLSECYNVLSVNSLFHNRQEVTAFIQKK